MLSLLSFLNMVGQQEPLQQLAKYYDGAKIEIVQVFLGSSYNDLQDYTNKNSLKGIQFFTDLKGTFKDL
ncbi:MAG: hypothetical protein HKN00_11630 [Flavobacteriaceae bacterium]|nr:hypothetical protein [Bacteroidia bacterium]NNF75829.1 hypothetical protein [Flavobacteriaceae bacterium]NNK74418.1 hypothetical protein [Flavobacteriaceae bacterium]